MRWCSVRVRLISWETAALKSSFGAFSSSSANWRRDSATMVFRKMLGQEMEEEEPSILNSNLLPVKAKGEVRLRSVVSLGISGRVSTPI